MMEHRESNLTHRQPSNEASLGWLLVCTVGAALFAVMIATQGALAQDIQDPSNGWFQKCGPVLDNPLVDNPQTPEVEGTSEFDPIVLPGEYPAGHRHLFFGATNISPDSTKDTLLTSGTTCRFKNGTDIIVEGEPDPSGGNRSAYWVPDLQLSDGTWAGGKQLNAYYKKGASSVDANDIVPYPDGLKMLIRDTTSSKASVKWFCSNINGEGNNGNLQERPYNCKATGTYPWVTAHITFPQCGDGRLDSPDHISHMAYPSSSGCPSSHPIVFPRLFVTVKYATSLGKGALLSGPEENRDPATGFHVDYFEAWRPGTLQFYVDACIHAGKNCNATPPPLPPGT
jgi:hypothetical protein